MTEREALKLALEALETGLCYVENEDFDNKQKFRGYEHLMPTDAAESIQEIKTAIAAVKEALAQPEKEPVALPEGKKLILVDGSFDELMYWLGRCEDKGHLENCADLIEPWEKFNYRDYTTQPASLQNEAPQRTWVGLDSEEIRKAKHHMVDGAYHYSFKQGAEWAEAKLKEKNT